MAISAIGILIKPDTHERNLYKQILSEFEQLGYTIVLEKDLTLDQKDIKFLYPDSFQIPAGKKALIKYLCGKTTTMVLFSVDPTMDINKEIEKLHQIKGKKDRMEGLRYKYNDIPITKQELEHRTGNYYKYMTQNLFHVFDDLNQIEYFVSKTKL